MTKYTDNIQIIPFYWLVNSKGSEKLPFDMENNTRYATGAQRGIQRTLEV